MRVVVAGILAGLFALLAAAVKGNINGVENQAVSFFLRLFFFLAALFFYSFVMGYR